MCLSWKSGMGMALKQDLENRDWKRTHAMFYFRFRLVLRPRSELVCIPIMTRSLEPLALPYLIRLPV